jgi:hypothetical protein
MSKPQNGINTENIWFYFDSIERDALDLGMLDRKSSQIQILKSKLLKLPQAQFDAAIKTIEKLVEDGTPTAPKRDLEAAKKKASKELYERTAKGSGKDLEAPSQTFVQ